MRKDRWRRNKGTTQKKKKRVDENNIQINGENGARSIWIAGVDMGNNEKKNATIMLIKL